MNQVIFSGINDPLHVPLVKWINKKRKGKKKEGVVYWFTYNISNVRQRPEVYNILEHLSKHFEEIRIIGCHPSIVSYDENVIKGIRRIKSDGLKIKVWTEELDDGQYRCFHAKGLFFKEGAAIGSFNLSESAVSDNIESALFLEAPHYFSEAERIWGDDYCKDLLDENWDICDEFSIYTRKGIREIARTAARKIESINKNHEKIEAIISHIKLRVYQINAIKNIEASFLNNSKEILSLPTGTGKTLVGIGWLLEHKYGGTVSEEMKNPFTKGRIIYVINSQWVQESIQKNMETILSYNGQGCVLKEFGIELVSSNIVSRNELLTAFLSGGKISAISFDEIQFWNWEDPGTQYSVFLNQVLQKNPDVKILGMSATPTRRNAFYDYGDFYKKFTGRQGLGIEGISFSDAQKNRYICPKIEWHQLWTAYVSAGNKNSRQVGPGNLPLPQNGTYGRDGAENAIMRAFWDALAGPSDRKITTLLNKIEEKIKLLKSKLKTPIKCLIFLPKIGERKIIFIDRFRRLFSGSSIYDVTNSTPHAKIGGQIRLFAHSKKDAYLMSVDRLSEGVSINDINVIIMLRMTISPVLPVQMIGRGIRTSPGKDALHVIDCVNIQPIFENMVGLSSTPVSAGVPAVSGASGNATSSITRKQVLDFYIENLKESDSHIFEILWKMRDCTECEISKKLKDFLLNSIQKNNRIDLLFYILIYNDRIYRAEIDRLMSKMKINISFYILRYSDRENFIEKLKTVKNFGQKLGIIKMDLLRIAEEFEYELLYSPEYLSEFITKNSIHAIDKTHNYYIEKAMYCQLKSYYSEDNELTLDDLDDYSEFRDIFKDEAELNFSDSEILCAIGFTEENGKIIAPQEDELEICKKLEEFVKEQILKQSQQ
jgi:superfamily II DNA or RNA helicase